MTASFVWFLFLPSMATSVRPMSDTQQSWATLLLDKVVCLTLCIGQLLTSEATKLLDRNHLYSLAISRCVAALCILCLRQHVFVHMERNGEKLQMPPKNKNVSIKTSIISVGWKTSKNAKIWAMYTFWHCIVFLAFLDWLWALEHFRISLSGALACQGRDMTTSF